MIRVLLADDQALVRAGFRALLEVQDGIEVAGEATDGADAYRKAAELAPDVILMDIRMPGTDGLEATRLITADEALSGVRILILTLTEREREVLALVAAGLSNEEIADRLVLSPLTAKTHVSRSMVKLGARDRAQLVVLAYESGLARPGWLD
jgi:DNA-binding NarL/FixJ family response regulator